MKSIFYLLVSTLLLCATTLSGQKFDIAEGVEKEGFFPLVIKESKGQIFLVVDKLNEEFLYVPALAAGLGSNDIGLDRGQLGSSRIVKFEKHGNKILLVQPNYDYRANSDNELEKRSVREAFASSVLFGFPIEGQIGSHDVINLTPFLMRDEHGVANRLAGMGEGSFRLDNSRSAINFEHCHNFPKNTLFQTITTFTGQPKGRYLFTVAPTAKSFSLNQFHSFVALPDDNYKPRVFDPRSGYFSTSYYDYATPIEESLKKRFINRHRLYKKDPSSEMSEAKEPIVYYLDSGCPEPVKSALLEGASWWNQAFEAAGYKDAFQVKVLPADAHPLDVRYNVIQWVHRSTRGWSYGSSVRDPRTGEIIKGHVSLGSLRVRQDFLIAQGLTQPYADSDDNHSQMMEMALARLRQLSAHEVGHTLGLVHNYSSSVDDRASVMDYPHPLILLTDNGEVDFSKAYDVGIGDWDKRTIIYGYQDFPDGTNEGEELTKILELNEALGLHFLSDQDARPAYGSSSMSHLWDNGSSAVKELQRMSSLRRMAMNKLSLDAIRTGEPYAKLIDVLVPIYLSHRYQAEAVSKVIAGQDYEYAVKGNKKYELKTVNAQEQRAAIQALVNTLKPEFLKIPQRLIDLLPPRPLGYGHTRELFESRMKPSFDPLSAAESSAAPILGFMIQSDRLSRLKYQHAVNPQIPSVQEYLTDISNAVNYKNLRGLDKEIAYQNAHLYLGKLLQIIASNRAHKGVLADVRGFVHNWKNKLSPNDGYDLALLAEIEKFHDDPSSFRSISSKKVPDGSPIGCSGHDH